MLYLTKQKLFSCLHLWYCVDTAQFGDVMKIVYLFAIWMIPSTEDIKKKGHKNIDPYFHQDLG